MGAGKFKRMTMNVASIPHDLISEFVSLSVESFPWESSLLYPFRRCFKRFSACEPCRLAEVKIFYAHSASPMH